MATVSPTPVHGHGPSYGRLYRHTSSARPMVRRDSPLSALANSQGFSSGALPLRSMGIGDDSEDDDLQPPPQLSALGQSVLEQYPAASPIKPSRSGRTRAPRNSSGSNTPGPGSTTPGAPSLRVRRVGLQGAPVRRARRTPQSEEEKERDREVLPQYAGEAQIPTSIPKHARVPSLDQENIPASISRVKRDGALAVDPGSTMKPMNVDRIVPIHVDRERNRAVPLAPADVNTPHRPAPPPPPKMSALETATSAAGSQAVKGKKRSRFVVNTKIYSQIKRLGKGGSSDVYQVMAENGAIYALKKVKLADADAAAIAGYKGEINLLKKLEKVERVVRIIDYQIDEEKQALYVVMEAGESDFSRILRMKMDDLSPANDPSAPSETQTSKLDINFTRFYWAEMLECLAQVHAHDIVHSDLKPANFLLVKGQLKLIDFGIANAIDIENTVNIHRDSHVGTPNYMSPESLQDASTISGATAENGLLGAPQSHIPAMGRNMKLGKPSDVWSLGIILYQMVYGKAPFGHIPNPVNRVLAIINPAVVIPYPATGIGGVKVPAELKRTLKSCLQRDPRLRPTCAQLLSEKDPFLHPEAASDDLRISQDLLGQIIWRVAERFRDANKPAPSDEEIKQYSGSFYAKIRDWAEEA